MEYRAYSEGGGGDGGGGGGGGGGIIEEQPSMSESHVPTYCCLGEWMTTKREAGERERAWVAVVVGMVQTKSQTKVDRTKSQTMDQTNQTRLDSHHDSCTRMRSNSHSLAMTDNANTAVVRAYTLSQNTALAQSPRPARVLMALPSSYQCRWDETNRSGEDTQKCPKRRWQSFINSRVKEWSMITQTGSILRCASSIHSRHSR